MIIRARWIFHDALLRLSRRWRTWRGICGDCGQKRPPLEVCPACDQIVCSDCSITRHD